MSKEIVAIIATSAASVFSIVIIAMAAIESVPGMLAAGFGAVASFVTASHFSEM